MSNVVNVHFTGTANFGPVRAQLASLQAAMLEMNATSAKMGGFTGAQLSGVKQAEAGMLAAARATGAFKVQTLATTSAAERLTMQFTKGKFSLGQYFTMMRAGAKSATAEIEAVALAQAKLKNTMMIPSATNAGMAHYVTNMSSMANAATVSAIKQQLVNTAWAQGSTQLINFGKNTQWAGRQLMVGFTMPVLALGGALAAMYYQMDKNLTMLQRVYGIGGNAGGMFQNVLPSDAEIADIRSKVIALSSEVAKTYGISAKETTNVAQAFAAAGYTQQKLLDMTATATKAMALGDTTMEESVKASISLQNTYKISTNEVGNAMNFFSAAQAATSTNMKDLIDAIPRVGPVVKNLGGSYKDLVAMIVALKEGGVAAGEGANAIKNSLQRIVSPTQKATEMLSGFGINLKNIVQANAGDLVGTIQELQAHLSALTPLARQQVLTELFGKYQASRMSALFENFNKMGTQSAKIMQMQALSAKQLGDIATHETQQIQKTGYGGFKIAIETLKTQLMPIGEQFLDIITKIVKGIGWFVEKLSFLTPYKNVLLAVLGGVAITGPILMITGLFMNLVGQFMKLILWGKMFGQGLRAAFTQGGGIVNGFKTVLSGLRNFFKEVDIQEEALKNTTVETSSAFESSATAITLLTEAMDKYIAALRETAQMQGTVKASAVGLRNGVAGSAASSAPVSPTAMSNLAAAAVLQQQRGNFTSLSLTGQAKASGTVSSAGATGVTLIPKSLNTAQASLGSRSLTYFSEAQRLNLESTLRSSGEHKALNAKITEDLLLLDETSKKQIVGNQVILSTIETRAAKEAAVSAAYTTIASWAEKIQNGTVEEAALGQEKLTELNKINNEYIRCTQRIQQINVDLGKEKLSTEEKNNLKLQLTEEYAIQRAELIKQNDLLSQEDIFIAKRAEIQKELLSIAELQLSDGEKVEVLDQKITELAMEEARILTEYNAVLSQRYNQQLQLSSADGRMSKILLASMQLGSLGWTTKNAAWNDANKSATRSHDTSQSTLNRISKEIALTQALQREVGVTDEAVIEESSLNVARQQLIEKYILQGMTTEEAVLAAVAREEELAAVLERRLAEEKLEITALTDLTAMTEKVTQLMGLQSYTLTIENMAAIEKHIVALEAQREKLLALGVRTDAQNIAVTQLTEEINLLKQKYAAAVPPGGGVAGGAGAGWKGAVGKASMGVGMGAMMAPMALMPLGEKMGGKNGAAVSGAGQGMMYGGMAGMALSMAGPYGQAAALALPFIGAAIGGIKGYTDAANEEIKKREQERADVIKSSYEVSSAAIDAFGKKMNNFANVNLAQAGVVVQENQDVVDKLAESYKAATDEQTKNYLSTLQKQRFGTPEGETNGFQTFLSGLANVATKIPTPTAQLFGRLAQGAKIGEVGGLFGAAEEQKAQLAEYQRGLKEKFWTDVVNGLTSDKAAEDILGVAKAVGDEGFATANLTSSLKLSLSKNKNTAQQQAFANVLGSGLSLPMTDIMKTGMVGLNSGGGFASRTAAGVGWTDVASSRAAAAGKELTQSQIDKIGAAQTAYNDAITATSKTLYSAISNVDPNVFAHLSDGLSKTNKGLMFSAEAFTKIKDQVAQSNPELASMMETLKNTNTPIKDVYEALNLMSQGLISTQEELMAVAQSADSLAASLATSVQQTTISTALGGTSIGSQVKDMISNQAVPSSSAAGGGNGGGGGPSPEETALQKLIDIRKKSIDNINKETDARQKLYDAKRKAIEQDVTLMNLQSDVANAMASGNLLELAKAQNTYNNELNNQAALKKKEALDSADQNRVDALQKQIDKLQKMLDKLNKASSGGSGGGGGAATDTAKQQQKMAEMRAQAEQTSTDLLNNLLSTDKKYNTVAEAMQNDALAQKIKFLEKLGIPESFIQDKIINTANKANLFFKKDFMNVGDDVKKNVSKTLDLISGLSVDSATKVKLANEVAVDATKVSTNSLTQNVHDINALLAKSGFKPGSKEYEQLKKGATDLFGLKYVDTGLTEKKIVEVANAVKTEWNQKGWTDTFGLTKDDAANITTSFNDAITEGLGINGAKKRAMETVAQTLQQKLNSGAINQEQYKKGMKTLQGWISKNPFHVPGVLEVNGTTATAGGKNVSAAPSGVYAGSGIPKENPSLIPAPPESGPWQSFMNFISTGLKVIGSAFDIFIMQPIRSILGTVTTVFTNILTFVTGVFMAVGQIVNTIVIQPLFKLFSKVSGWINDNVVTPIKDFFAPIVGWINDNVVQPMLNIFRPIAQWFFDYVISRIVDRWNTIVTAVTTVVDTVKGIWNGVVTFFQTEIIDKIKGAWNSFTTGITEAFSGSATDIANHFIDAFNVIRNAVVDHAGWLSGPISAIWPIVPHIGAQDGGYISGPGTGTSDSIPTMLSNGEYVIRASSVSRYGQQMLDMINSGNYSPQFNSPTARSNYSTDGLVGESSSMSNVEYNINVNVAGSNADPNDIASAVMNALKQKEAANMTRRNIG